VYVYIRLTQVCDFGLAKWKDYSQTHTNSRSNRAGTVTHIPPEIWIDINEPRAVKCDVYSFAVLLWELFTEQKPFRTGNYRRLFSMYFFCKNNDCIKHSLGLSY